MGKKAKTNTAAQTAAPITPEQHANDPRTFRAVAVTIETRQLEDGKTEAVVRASVSSEEPYLRYMYDENGERVRAYEVLGHNEGEIDFSYLLVIEGTKGVMGSVKAPADKEADAEKALNSILASVKMK